jgi:hypothetical protein
MNRSIVMTTTAAAALILYASAASADSPKYHAEPSVFIGKAGVCGADPGHRIVTAGWIEGMGLPDNGATAPGGSKEKNDGLLLNKNGATSDCSAAGATIKELKKKTVLSELGFDYRVGGHCGAGAPRFNVTTSAGGFYFVGGCAAGAHTPNPQGDSQWERVRFGNADFFQASGPAAPFVLGTTKVDSIEIVYDEGTDTGSASDPNGVGLAVLDNIDINGFLIRDGGGDIKSH